MKKIEAIIQQSKMLDVSVALQKIGQGGLTFTDVRGFGRQKGRMEHYRGTDYNVKMLPKVLVMALVADDQVDKVVDVFLDVAKTGNVGDGKIVVSSIDDVVRVRTGERGEQSL